MDDDLADLFNSYHKAYLYPMEHIQEEKDHIHTAISQSQVPFRFSVEAEINFLGFESLPTWAYDKL